MARDDAGFEAFATVALPRLRRLALALVGDAGHADDLVQGTLERLYRSWARIEPDDPMRYARRALVNRMISESRRPWRRHERLTDVAPDPTQPDRVGVVLDRSALLGALSQLPARQRQTVVLRYLEDMSIEDVAHLLRCAPGTVKRASHDGLANLRRTIAETPEGASRP